MPNIHAYIAVGGENKLLHLRMAEATGQLQSQGALSLNGAPGPLAVDPAQRHLYVGLRSTSELVSFHIDQQTGDLSPFGPTVALDADPCYLATDRRGRFLLSSYYGAGKIAVHPLADDGSIGAQPTAALPTAERAHCIQTDRSNRYLFVPHTAGPNLIFQFHFDEETGTFTPNAVPQVIPLAGEGPRHFVFHPQLDILYFSNEQGCSVTAYRFDVSSGTLSPFQTLSTLPADFAGENTCAQIQIHPSGHFLYVANRGHDSIACYAIDNAGVLTSRGQQKTEPVPRTFNLDPTGNFLFAAGQGSGVLASYRIDQETGLLQPLTSYDVGERPMWVMLLDL